KCGVSSRGNAHKQGQERAESEDSQEALAASKASAFAHAALKLIAGTMAILHIGRDGASTSRRLVVRACMDAGLVKGDRKRLCSPFSRMSCRIKRSSSPCSPWMPGCSWPAGCVRGGLEVELLNREPDQLGNPQCVPERQ